MSGAVWEEQWSTGSGFVAVCFWTLGFSIEPPPFSSFNIMIRKMLRCCGFLLATAKEHTGSGRMEQPGVNVMEQEEFVFLSFHLFTHIMLQLLLTSWCVPTALWRFVFSFFGSLLSFVLYVATSEYRRERRLSPCGRKNSFLLFLIFYLEIVVLGDHGNRPVRMRKKRFRRDLRIFAKIWEEIISLPPAILIWKCSQKS